MFEYKIYGLKLIDCDQIKYIGMTKRNLQVRLNQHFRDSKRFDHKNSRWVRKYKENIEIILIEDNIKNKSECCEKEKDYIKLFKSFGANLNNSTIGGDGGAGMTGRKHSDESKRKISESHKGKKQGPAWNKGMKGSPGGPKKGTKFTEEHKRKLSESAKKRIRKNVSN